DRGGRARPVRRQGRGGRGGRRQDRQHRRRQDLRDAGRDGDPHSNRRARSIRAVIKETIRVKRLTLVLLTLFVLAAAASGVRAQTPPPPPPPAAAPGSTATPAAPASKIDRGDTAWMLTSTALVLLMAAPGLALFYGGMVRQKNALATLMQSFIIMAIISIQW